MEIPGLGFTSVRQQNVGILKEYSENNYRLVHMRSMRIPGFEERHPAKAERRKGNAAEKMKSSLSRSRSMVYELALCNPWEYFVTLTLSPVKFDRYDLSGFYKRFSKWVNNYNSRSDSALKYLLVPEPHKDGAWHMHGLFYGLPSSHLVPFSLTDNLPLCLLDMIRKGRSLYNWPAYSSSFGYVTLEPVIDRERCAAYMTKYITKELGQSGIELNHHLYYCSKSLRRAEEVYRGQMLHSLVEPDFKNDFVQLKSLESIDEGLAYFCD